MDPQVAVAASMVPKWEMVVTHTDLEFQARQRAPLPISHLWNPVQVISRITVTEITPIVLSRPKLSTVELMLPLRLLLQGTYSTFRPNL